MNESHAHDYGHIHPISASSNLGKAFAWGVGLNLSFIVLEVVFGHIAGSVALVADAAHNFSDVIGLLLSWGALILAQKIPQGRYTYGYRSATILAVLASTLFLFIAVGDIVWSAATRFGEPVEVQTGIVMIVATVGIGINGLSAWLLSRGQDDLNVKSAFIHLVGDAAISAGVVIAGIVIHFTKWNMLDSLVSIGISALVLWGGPTDMYPANLPIMNFQNASKSLIGDLTKDGHYLVECTHNCGHAVPPFDVPAPPALTFDSVWRFVLDHPFWLGPSTSPYAGKPLPAAYPSWCGQGQGTAVPRASTATCQ